LIYTYVSSILIAVNPFKMLPLYTPERLDEYKEKGARDLPPHVYAIADNAYRSMLSDDKSQSCICSGESGAGKTEATKSILQYLAEVSGGLSVKATDNTGSLEQQILQANPVMEAFGNAKTSRNNNSSRFGKLISIMFDAKGSIVGGSIINYLLEKSRVVGQSNEERNYHIFYQILAGQHAEENEKLKALKLGEPEDYQYTNQSGCIHIDGVSDEKEFEDVRNAMTSLRLTPEEQLGVFRVTGALLVAGNLEFEVVQRQTQEDASEIKNMDCLKKVASMLDVEHADLNRSLTSHNIGAMSKILVAYSETQAKDARDAMVKKVYSNLFNWLIEKINATLALGEGGATAKAQINVLDIFGFESFELNSFEQLCINYCNEKLQSHFNEHIFKLEQDEYKSQGVVVADTAFKDNQPCLDMLEMKNTGVFAMLDEEIRVPKGSDAGFLQKILDRYVVKVQIGTPRRRPSRSPPVFVMRPSSVSVVGAFLVLIPPRYTRTSHACTGEAPEHEEVQTSPQTLPRILHRRPLRRGGSVHCHVVPRKEQGRSWRRHPRSAKVFRRCIRCRPHDRKGEGRTSREKGEGARPLSASREKAHLGRAVQRTVGLADENFEVHGTALRPHDEAQQCEEG
jgi:myosin heavy subunit